AAVSIPLLSKPWRSIAISYDSLLSVPRMLLNSDTVPRILFISFHWSLLMTRSFCTIGWFSSSPSSPFAITQWISVRGKDSRITLRKGRLCTTSPRELGLITRIFRGGFLIFKKLLITIIKLYGFVKSSRARRANPEDCGVLSVRRSDEGCSATQHMD